MILRKLTLQTKYGVVFQARYTDKENTGNELNLLGKSVHVIGLETGKVQNIRMFVDNKLFRFLKKLTINASLKQITYKVEYHEDKLQ